MFNVLAELNWIAVVVAFVVYAVFGYVWFALLFSKAYNISLGRDAAAQQAEGSIYIVGPAVSAFVNVVTSAVLIHTLEITTYGNALQFGAIVGFGYLVAMTFTIAINPNFPRPLRYGLVNGPYFFIASLIVSTILVAVR